MAKVYPKIKSITYFDEYLLVDKISVFFNNKKVNVFIKFLENLEYEEVDDEKKANVLFENDSALGKEAYRIVARGGVIKIYSSTDSGAFYGFITLRLLLDGVNKTKEFELYDEPDLKVRGLMMDISRNKVPKVETIKKIIDMMAFLKLNHLELYVEGFSFEYEGFKKYLKDDGYITKSEYLEIEKYANERFIDLVPNENGFGHMEKWLDKDEFKELAECPDGIFLWGRNRAPSTLNPLDPKSVELISKLYDEMLPISNSKYFNMNFDEPFELGKGKSMKECQEKGIGNVYIDYTLKAYEALKKYDKTPLIWMDVLLRHPDLLDRLPKDMIFVDWGYDSFYSFDSNLKKLKKTGIPFMVAPGTSSWCSFLGRTDEAFEGINNATKAVIEHGGLGTLVTDWGDFGHLQYLPVSYGPIVYSALLSWRYHEGEYREVKHVLNKYIFKDKNNLIADIVLDLGRYNRYENAYIGNGTEAFYTYMWASLSNNQENPVEYFLTRVRHNLFNYDKYEMFENFFDLKIKELDKCKLECDDGKIILDELKESIGFVNSIHKLMIAFCDEVALEKRISLLDEIIESHNYLLEERKRLWLARNKISDFEESFNHVVAFIEFANKTREYLIRGEHYEIKD